MSLIHVSGDVHINCQPQIPRFRETIVFLKVDSGTVYYNAEYCIDFKSNMSAVLLTFNGTLLDSDFTNSNQLFCHTPHFISTDLQVLSFLKVTFNGNERNRLHFRVKLKVKLDNANNSTTFEWYKYKLNMLNKGEGIPTNAYDEILSKYNIDLVLKSVPLLKSGLNQCYINNTSDYKLRPEHQPCREQFKVSESEFLSQYCEISVETVAYNFCFPDSSILYGFKHEPELTLGKMPRCVEIDFTKTETPQPEVLQVQQEYSCKLRCRFLLLMAFLISLVVSVSCIKIFS